MADNPNKAPNVFRAEINAAGEQRTNDGPPPSYRNDTRYATAPRQKNRLCPNARSCFSLDTFKSFDIFHTYGDRRLLMRRIYMLGILLIRTVTSVWDVVKFHRSIAGLIVAIILAIVGFFFVAWCLATIGNASGHRKVLGVVMGRLGFDMFLLTMFLLHVGIFFVTVFFNLSIISLVIWIFLWLLLFGAAWVCTWPAEEETTA